jgi:hypothetical protein
VLNKLNTLVTHPLAILVLMAGAFGLWGRFNSALYITTLLVMLFLSGILFVQNLDISIQCRRKRFFELRWPNRRPSDLCSRPTGRRRERYSMKVQPLPGIRTVILECIDAVVGLDDAMAIITASYDMNTNRVLLRDRQLPVEFFELHTGFAGEFIQKLVNYRITVACVFETGGPQSERFREYVAEAKRGRQFRSFADEDEAIAWLARQ